MHHNFAISFITYVLNGIIRVKLTQIESIIQILRFPTNHCELSSINKTSLGLSCKEP